MTTTPTQLKPAMRAIAAEPGHLSPPFNPRNKKYVLLTTAQTDEVTITIDAGDDQLTVNGRPIPSGQPIEISIEVGRTTVPIVVTSPDGQCSSSCTLTIRRPTATPTWQCVAKINPWPARDSAGELVFNDQIWLFGGYTPKVIDDVWRSSNGIDWEPMPAIAGSGGINIPIRFVLDGYMWLTTNNGKYIRSRDGITWTPITGPMPWSGRTAAGCVVFKDRVWIMGGMQDGKRRNDVWSSADGLNWRQETAAAPWSRRQLHDNVVVHDGMIWVIGGGIQNYHPWKVYRDVWRSPDGVQWEQVTDNAPWEGRNWASCLVYHGRMWLLGGFRAEPRWANFNDVWYSTDGADWRQLTTPDIWSPRHEISPYVFDEKLWVIAGNAWPLMNDTWHLKIDGLTFLTQPSIEEFVDAQYTYRALADFNRSRQPIRYRLLKHPDWLSIHPGTGVVRGTPSIAQPVDVTIEAYDDAGETATQTYTIHMIE